MVAKTEALDVMTMQQDFNNQTTLTAIWEISMSRDFFETDSAKFDSSALIFFLTF